MKFVRGMKCLTTEEENLLRMQNNEKQKMKTDENNPKHSNYSVKQVIVMRKDLNMRKGKMIAQGAHASMKAILYQMEKSTSEGFGDKGTIVHYTLSDRQQ